MENPYIDYYLKQAGSGITGYSGSRYHMGNGLFGKILKHLKPALKYIGKQGWETLKSISSGVMSGDSLEDAGKEALIKTTKNVLTDASNKLETYKRRKQTGGGKRKRSVSLKKPCKRRKKTSKKIVKKGYKRKPKRKKTIKRKRKNIKNIEAFF